MFKISLQILVFATSLVALAGPTIALDESSDRNRNPRTCVYPQPCWPSNNAWNSLNRTVGGRLFRARPPAYVCHVPFIDEAACNTAKENWGIQFWRAEQPGGYFDIAWENGNSYCNIDNDPNVPCDQGLVPIYVVKAKDVTDLQKAVTFARQNKLSTRIKGASNDLLGRSSGNGTFGISTIDLKGINFENNFKPKGAPSSFSGQSVVHVAAGEFWYDVYKAANDRGLLVVGAQSGGVGAAGGYVIGGGHSTLSSQYGMAVDHVLQYEVITADSEVKIANRYRNQDLFWALRGGGPGFGIVTKVTYRTHPAIHQIVKFQLSVTYTQASYREFLKTRLGLQRNLAAANFTAYFWPSPTGFNANLWGHNSADISGKNATLLPLYQWAQQETAAGRPATVQNTAEVLDSYFDIFDLPPDQQSLGAGTLLVGGSRLLPFSSMEGAPLDTLIDVLMETPVIAVFMVGGGKIRDVDSAATSVNPVWRISATHLIQLLAAYTTDTPFDVRDALWRNMTALVDRLNPVAPVVATYHNDYIKLPNRANHDEPQWSTTFWGSNYPRLLSIKNTVDPDGIFTCHHCVGDRIES